MINLVVYNFLAMLFWGVGAIDFLLHEPKCKLKTLFSVFIAVFYLPILFLTLTKPATIQPFFPEVLFWMACLFIAVYDFVEFTIPTFSTAATILVLFGDAVIKNQGWINFLIKALSAFIFMHVLRMVFLRIKEQEPFGAGDVFLVMLFSVFMNLEDFSYLLIISSFVGLVFIKLTKQNIAPLGFCFVVSKIVLELLDCCFCISF